MGKMLQDRYLVLAPQTIAFRPSSVRIAQKNCSMLGNESGGNRLSDNEVYHHRVRPCDRVDHEATDACFPRGSALRTWPRREIPQSREIPGRRETST